MFTCAMPLSAKSLSSSEFMHNSISSVSFGSFANVKYQVSNHRHHLILMLVELDHVIIDSLGGRGSQ